MRAPEGQANLGRMRRWVPALLGALAAGCSGGEDPEALFKKSEDAWAASTALIVEAEVRGRLVVERQTADEDVGLVSMVFKKEALFVSARASQAAKPFVAFGSDGNSLFVGVPPNEGDASPLAQPVALSARRASARGGIYGCFLTLLAAGRGKKNPENLIEVSRLTYVGREKVGEIEAHVLQYNFELKGDWPYRAVVRAWLDPQSFAPLKREVQGARAGAKEVSVETYLRFEPRETEE